MSYAMFTLIAVFVATMLAVAVGLPPLGFVPLFSDPKDYDRLLAAIQYGENYVDYDTEGTCAKYDTSAPYPSQVQDEVFVEEYCVDVYTADGEVFVEEYCFDVYTADGEGRVTCY